MSLVRQSAARFQDALSLVAGRRGRLRLQLGESAAALKRLSLSNSVRLEASSKCQLKCPACPTARNVNRTGVVGWGNLTLEAFKRFVRANPQIGHIEVSNWGEIFLNPELNEIVRHAYKSRIKLTGNNGVNFNSVSDDTLETLVKCRFRSLTISIDGATPATYREYRKGGEFDRVIANIKKLNQYKRQHASRYPILTWQFVIFGHNEHELAQARALARELKMNFSAKLNTENWGPQYSPVKNLELVRAESGLGVASVGEFREKYQREFLGSMPAALALTPGRLGRKASRLLRQCLGRLWKRVRIRIGSMHRRREVCLRAKDAFGGSCNPRRHTLF